MGPWPCSPAPRSISIWCEGPAPPGDAVLLDAAGLTVGRHGFQPHEDGIYIANCKNLSPDTYYEFIVERGGEEHHGSFLTIPEPDGLVRIAVGADIHPESKPYLAFSEIERRRPHIFLGLGDHVYADLDSRGPIPPTDEAYEKLYRRTWDDPHLQSCFRHVPSVLMWDDHETWNDYDGTLDPVRGDAARRAYIRFQRSRQPSPEVWTRLDAGPARIFILDTRSCRDPNAALDGAEKSMLGRAQRDALFDFLREPFDGFKIVATPTPVHRYADTGADAWAHGFSHERQLILDVIDEHTPQRTLLVSGDQHWPAIVEIELRSGAKVMEFMCTPTAAFSRPPPRPEALGDDVLFVGQDERGFGYFEIEQGHLEFTWIDETGVERFHLIGEPTPT